MVPLLPGSDSGAFSTVMVTESEAGSLIPSLTVRVKCRAVSEVTVGAVNADLSELGFCKVTLSSSSGDWLHW